MFSSILCDCAGICFACLSQSTSLLNSYCSFLLHAPTNYFKLSEFLHKERGKTVTSDFSFYWSATPPSQNPPPWPPMPPNPSPLWAPSTAIFAISTPPLGVGLKCMKPQTSTVVWAHSPHRILSRLGLEKEGYKKVF